MVLQEVGEVTRERGTRGCAEDVLSTAPALMRVAVKDARNGDVLVYSGLGGRGLISSWNLLQWFASR